MQTYQFFRKDKRWYLVVTKNDVRGHIVKSAFQPGITRVQIKQAMKQRNPSIRVTFGKPK